MAGRTCVETPEGRIVAGPEEGAAFVPVGVPHMLTGLGAEQRRSLVIVLRGASSPASAPAHDWTPRGLCRGELVSRSRSSWQNGGADAEARMPYRVPAALDLSEAERTELQRRARRRKTAQALALRARIVLRAAAGLSSTAVAADLGVAEHTAGRWRERFARLRADGLLDEPRPGAPRRTDDGRIAALLDRTPAERPEGGTRWSRRTMAKASGPSATTVGRAWRASGLRPHRTETFRLSTDPLFAEKVRDIVGLHLAPPDRALVLCVDEKSLVRALDRTQPPLLPLRRRRRAPRARRGAGR